VKETSREIAAFATPVEANLARLQLEEAGIPSYVADESASSVFGMTTPLGGIRLYVGASDVERALGVLDEMEKTHLAARDAPEAEEEPEPESEEEFPGEEESVDEVVDPAKVDPEGEAWAGKARTLAAVGLVIFPLAFAAVARLLSRPKGVTLSPDARNVRSQAWFLALVAIVAWAAVFAVLWRPFGWFWRPRSSWPFG
jgi:hypothetical protein